MTPPDKVWLALLEERAYQEERWGGCTSQGKHTVTEFLVFMRDYIEEAMHHVSRNEEPAAARVALHAIRKVTAMGVACMEQHDAPRREPPRCSTVTKDVR